MSGSMNFHVSRGCIVATAFLLLIAPATSRAEEDTKISTVQRKAAELAMQRGLDWLVPLQQESGAWSNTNFPALTAMPLLAMVRSGREDLIPHIQRATDFLISCAKTIGPDKGAIYQHVDGRRGGGLSNYNTALSLIALHAVQESSLFEDGQITNLVPVILDARAFLAASQYLGDSVHYGGMGYDPPTERSYADLSNAYLGYEAIRITESIEELRPGGARVDLNWQAATRFIERIQNLPEVNDRPWATDHPDEVGGFTYRADIHRDDFGAFIDEDGVERHRSARTMSFAGLVSYLYAGVSRDDERVQAAKAWIQRNWNPEIPNRNPELAGTPSEMGGFFYYLKVLSRALQIYDTDTLTLADGSTVNWRDQVISVIAAHQTDDGFWINEYGRYWEADPVLSTAYALLALQNALGM